MQKLSAEIFANLDKIWSRLAESLKFKIAFRRKLILPKIDSRNYRRDGKRKSELELRYNEPIKVE